MKSILRIVRLAATLVFSIVILFAVSCNFPSSTPIVTPTITPAVTPSITPSEPPTVTSTTTPTIKPIPTTVSGNLDVYFIDVGQGDSIFIDYGTTEVLIDGGEKSPGITDFIRPYIDGPLDCVVATHPHSDHIGGLIAVLKTFAVSDVWTNGETYSGTTYNEFVSAEDSSGATEHIAKRGDVITVGNLSFSVLHPDTPTNSDPNENSIVLYLDYGNVGFLFTGDAGKPSEASMLSAGIVQHADILKIGHHGSRTASSPQFIQAVNPEVAIYMAGLNNSYHLPNQDALDIVSSLGAKIYGTDKNGTIEVSTDGTNYTVTTEK